MATSKERLRLPRHPDLPIIQETETDLSDPAGLRLSIRSERERPKKILHVADSMTSRMMVSIMLFREFEVIVARSEVEGLAIARAEAPDLILLDLSIPATDGFEVCRHFRQDEQLRRIPIIVLSALGNAETRLEAGKAGCDDCLAKPVRGLELLARIRRLIEAPDSNRRVLENEASPRDPHP